MAEFADTCPACKSSFTNYTVQPLKYCSVACQLDTPIIENLCVGEIRPSKSVRVKEDK